ncbi:MAG TPA: transposase, partial [Chloroflexota bacterium]|nr:transposase [Chloroflexota bacterium]
MQTTPIRSTYRFRLEPSASQRAQLERFAGARRWCWNWALATWRAFYRGHGVSIPARELSAQLTALKGRPETAWLREMDAQALQQVLADLRRAFANFFARRTRYPRFKRKKDDPARFRIPQRVGLVGAAVRVPKIGMIPLRLSRPVEGTIKSATFRRDATGSWCVSLAVQIAMPAVNRP